MSTTRLCPICRKDHSEYLGDGVYASYDGYAVWLDLRGQFGGTPNSEICLEPAVFDALTKYVTRMTDPKIHHINTEDHHDA